MTVGAFLEGLGGGLFAGRDAKMRERELSVLEAMAGRGQAMPRAPSMAPRGVSDIPAGGFSQQNESVSFSGDLPNVDPSIISGIYETAEALQADPLDVATWISYETAGTFDPVKAGPVTQHGKHRGLIQWGEPQARTYGVDWNDPIGSQLGRDGAIVRYFTDRGWKPGMSGLDGYSIINAGSPGRYNASDAHNGGMPGTVRDKWENQMHDHRAKAAALLQKHRPQPAAAAERGVVGVGESLVSQYYR